MPPADGDDVLDDREAEARPPGRARSVRPEETLEEAGQVFVRNAAAVICDGSTVSPRGCVHRHGAGRSFPGIADGVLDEVPGKDVEHPLVDRELDRGGAVEGDPDSGGLRAWLESADDLLEHAESGRRSEPDDGAAALQLGEEHHVVDQLAHLHTSSRASSISASASAPGNDALSRSAMSRASGVRSSWETAAVKPARSSS